ncbi:rhodanese-like domain-containing protein [Flavivirga aquimarina]|uniref:Rhodanese-like domain-containing protein n=1 Tax=Flavivirga aquimarina TaxID=2027862 RepID=A0ABT8WCF1_9FLAO|nr:rhodanese-like domain-containing protein [Flavivirga aquimarina]MDO5970747.1 rhodanese-like domain-containing protein [Flavivirga aquimarina]
MKRLILFLCTLFSLSATNCKGKDSSFKETIKVVSPKVMQTLLAKDSIQLIDVRTPEEFEQGYIEGAQNINYLSATFNSDIKKLDKTKPVILYCKSGGRSAKSSRKLLDIGFTEIYDLTGGITRWKEEGFEITIE